MWRKKAKGKNKGAVDSADRVRSERGAGVGDEAAARLSPKCARPQVDLGVSNV